MAPTDDFLTSTLRLRNKYLNLLEASLTGTLIRDAPLSSASGYDPTRYLGVDWPSLAQTMIGTARMRKSAATVLIRYHK
ncbi:MAG: hypothetical protein ABSC06_37080 [Rhodopila sp.]|jgi:O-methyltransferase/8-demethyl-8-(2,3-dimethoxy-alpha-L-rhamnosyl)tetracenomycin-C 4'-O-methyltransferase